MRKRLRKLHFSYKLEGMRRPREIATPARRASAGAAIPRFALYGEAPAWELGFEDPAYFNRFFRRRTGLTPGRWREQNRLRL